MKPIVTGIHHVTAIASNPQASLDFYTGLLGLRLVKKTVNFDDPSAYHLYYGDETGSAGSIVTFFYWPAASARGRVGVGQSTALVFSVMPSALGHWEQRLHANGVTTSRSRRFGEDTLRFADSDGTPIEIVAVTEDPRRGWKTADILEEDAIRGLHTVELSVRSGDPTQRLLTNEMGFRPVRSEGNRARLEVGPGGSGRFVDLIVDGELPEGNGGVGTIHHVAWSVPDDPSELEMLQRLRDAGYGVSDVRDRDYFHSIYWREPAGILFEIATENPGFAVDEPLDQLGAALKLPRQFERSREEIEKSLPPINRAPAPKEIRRTKS